jgi:hypothetical protein
MKRTFIILAALAVAAAAAHAQAYTFLNPPTLAVVDFEVSMSAADKEASKSYYGQLISQAMLSVLVQQNASDVVSTPHEVAKIPGAPVYFPGADAKPPTGFALFGPSPEERAAEAAKGQDIRYYFPPIFKIFDKKYVELALQNANFTTRDLYTKAAGAFGFMDLDFLVLGNVYETKAGTRDAVGFNVRVLNTKRAEELYSYSAVVDKDLHDLPIACATISQRIMRDILNSHCAQFVITKAADVNGLNTPFVNVPSQNTQGDAPNYRLFWQSRQVEKDDNTVADSADSDKREVKEDLFYWTLPGQYVISLYNIDTQQVRTIPFTIAAGDIKHVAIQRQHLEAEKGSITIGGIFPTDSYKFVIAEEKRTEQYWWEIGQKPKGGKPITVKFENGEKPEVTIGDEKKAATAAADTQVADARMPVAEYRAATNEIVVRNVMLSAYSITANSQPPAGASDVTGSWRVSTRLAVQSKPLPIDLRAQKDMRLMIADFGLQEKKALDMPRKTKVTFFFNPGFGFWNYLTVDDQVNVDSLWWRDKTKVTIESEYSPADWDALPDVTYTFEPLATFNGVEVTVPIFLKKADLEPFRDTVIIIDWFAEAEKVKEQRARDAQGASKQPPASPVSTAPAAPTQGAPARGTAGKTAAPLGALPLELSAGAGMSLDFSSSDSKWTQTGTAHEVKQSAMPIDIKAFFDFTYVQASIGYMMVNGSSTATTVGGSTTNASVTDTLSYVTLAAYGKYPFVVGPVTLFPLLGIEYKLNLTYENASGTDLKAAMTNQAQSDLSELWVEAGAGGDITFGRFYLRTELLIGFKPLSTTDNSAVSAQKTLGYTSVSLSYFTVNVGLLFGYKL